MNIYEPKKCEACGHQEDEHPTLEQTCHMLQNEKARHRISLIEIRDLKLKIIDLEEKMREEGLIE